MPYDDCLSGAWLSTWLGIDTARIDRMRRSGELIGIRPDGASAWLYPAWQFQDGKPRAAVTRILAAAADAGLDEHRLYAVLTMRAGLGAEQRRLVDVLAAGGDDQVVTAVRESRPLR
jgi:hypothetical protein